MKRLVLVSVLGLLFLAALASGQVMRGKRVVEDASYLRYEGTLTDPSGNPVSGVHEMTFRIYDSPASLTPVWEESQQVAVDGGVFEAILGKGSSVPRIDGSDYYIGVFVDGEELLPRHRIAGTVISGEDASSSVTGPVPTPYFPVDQMDERYVNVTGDSMSGDLYVDGNVGIGVLADPFALMCRESIDGDILKWGYDALTLQKGDSGVFPYIQWLDSTGTRGMYLGWGSPGEHIDMRLENGNNLAITGGNVGIGTTTPVDKLHVVGNTAVDGVFNVNTGNVVLGMGEGNFGGYQYQSGYYWGSLPSTKTYDVYSTTEGGSSFYVEYDGDAYFRGNVGIGTTSPGEKLDVNGDIQSSVAFMGIGGNGSNYAHFSHKNYKGAGQYALLQNGIAGHTYLNSVGTGNLYLRNDNVDHMTILNNGNVGIGTTSPGAKLEVMGSVRIADRLKFSQNGYWADMDVYTGSPSSWPRLNIYETPGGGSRTKTAQYSQGALSLTASSASIDVNGPISAKDNSSSDAAVYGETASLGHSGGSDMGVYGWAYSGGASVGGAAIGVLGRVNSYQGSSASVPAGVFGWATATSGVNAGVWGETNSPDGFGVYSKGNMNVDGNLKCNGTISAGSSSSKISVGTYTATNIITVVQNSSTDPVADAWTTYSSRRWKTNIEPIEGALDKVERLQGVSFDWKEDGRHDIGLIAEEVGKVIPEVVTYEANGIDAQALDYSRLVAVLIEAVKEQQAEIEELRSQMEIISGAGMAMEGEKTSSLSGRKW